jgi:drug/metabolite transporter (DMT)-like permease
MLLAVSVIWGVAGPVIKFTLSDFPPLVFLTYRFWLTSLFALPVMLVVKPKWPGGLREWLMVGAFGLFNTTINLGLLFWGFDKTTALDGTLISATSPILVVIAGALLLKEKVTRRERLGLGIAFLGTLVTVVQPLLEGNALAITNIKGNLLVLAANFAWVTAVVISKVELRHKMSPLFLAGSSFVVGFITILPITMMKYGFSWDRVSEVLGGATWGAHAGVWYMALISGLLAYTLYQKGQKTIEASEATLFGYLNPIFAAPLAVWWLGERVTLPFLLGAAVIACGVSISEWRGRMKNTRG